MIRSILTVVAFMSTVISAQTITLSADVWEPYNGKPESAKPGYAVEMIKTIFAKKGITVNYTVLPWARAVDAASKGEIAGVFGALTDDAPGFVFPKEEINVSRSSFITVKSGSWNYEGIESVKKIKIGAVADYSYFDEIDSYFETAIAPSVQKMSGDNPLDQNFKKLVAGRIDVLIEDANVIDFYLASTKQAALIRKAGTVGNEKIFIAFSPKNPKSAEYAKILDEGIVEMRKNGQLKALLANYGLSDWK